MMDRIPSQYLPDVVRLHTYAGSDEYGTPTYVPPLSEAGTAYAARVIYRDRSIMTRTGQLVHERGMVLIHGDPPPVVKVEDRLVLPGGEVPPLMEAAAARDGEGTPRYARVSFG